MIELWCLLHLIAYCDLELNFSASRLDPYVMEHW